MSTSDSESPSPPVDNLLSRRDFAILSVAAGLTAAAAGTARAAAPNTVRAVEIKTADGRCDAVFVCPPGRGHWPAVIVWPDAYGLRPAMEEIGRRLAGEGYAALVVNPFYRVRRAPVFPPGFSFANPADRAQLMPMMAALDETAVTRDARALIAWLDAQREVDSKARIGSAGFCMGGKMTIWTAAAVPGRVGAATSFHGGGLATDAANSPHKLIAGTRAAYHIGIAADDDEKEPQAKTVLKATLDTAGRPATIEVYPGAKHGWMMSDQPVYDREQAERGWAAMLALYKGALV